MASDWLLVVNCSPLIALAKIGLMAVLDDLAIEVRVPEAVWREVCRGPSEDPTATALARLRRRRHVDVDSLDSDVTSWNLGVSEAAVLTIARRDSAIAVLDDRRARQCAKALSVPHIGTLGLLVEAKRRGLVSQIAPLLPELRRARIHLSTALAAAVLRSAGETAGASPPPRHATEK